MQVAQSLMLLHCNKLAAFILWPRDLCRAEKKSGGVGEEENSAICRARLSCTIRWDLSLGDLVYEMHQRARHLG